MRRYTTLLLTAFLLLAIVIAGSAYLAGTGHIDHRTREQEITVLTTLPAEEAEILSQADGFFPASLRASIKKSTVEPVPTPSTSPSVT